MNPAHIDLVGVPFTLPRSRLFLLMDTDESLALFSAEYEIPLQSSAVLTGLSVRRDGEKLPINVESLSRLKFGRDAELTFTSFRSLRLKNIGQTDLDINFNINDGEVNPTHWFPRLKHVEWAHVSGSLTNLAPGKSFTIVTGCGGQTHELDEDENFADHMWSEWMSKSPQVSAADQDYSDLCWSVLGSNTLEIDPKFASVVPSKLGYVGHWQWDSYFIALGLMHGDFDLAKQQIDGALAHQAINGQLPDVVHDFGVLMNFSNLPSYEFEKFLERSQSVQSDPALIPLTKPPLTAWAVSKMLSQDSRESLDWYRDILAKIQRSQNWWLDFASDQPGGTPRYQHPYSSGLDDSPVFDTSMDPLTPDLIAYLIKQRDILKELSSSLGLVFDSKGKHLDSVLMELWDEDVEMFLSLDKGRKIYSRTVLSLMPLIIEVLPSEVVSSIIDQIIDPEIFGGEIAIPTVARNDPDFNSSIMWRGPIWLNINYLVIDGLRLHGETQLADQLLEKSLDLVKNAGGPFEYFDAETGMPGKRAVGAFSWTAALFIHMAREKFLAE